MNNIHHEGEGEVYQNLNFRDIFRAKIEATGEREWGQKLRKLREHRLWMFRNMHVFI